MFVLMHQARRKVGDLFRKNQHVKDQDVIEILVGKGYMELEETLMQYKQRTHLQKMLSKHAHSFHLP